MKEIQKAIGTKIKEIREEKGITQKELGELLGYSPMGVSYFEKGTRDLKISDLKKLSDFFSKPLSFFLVSDQTLYRANSNAEDNPAIEFSLKKFDDFLDSQNL